MGNKTHGYMFCTCGRWAYAVIVMSFSLTMLIINQEDVAIAISIKSVTTSIGITLTEQLSGDVSITPLLVPVLLPFFS
ncbi:MAG: LrgB family protein [Colwellia sp.]|nr:LrgB family protein [Colwellia sp.]